MTWAIVAMCIAGAGCLLIYAYLIRDTQRAARPRHPSQRRFEEGQAG